ncbi:putative Ubiquitin and WLM domain-containing protein [Cinnamomum micranthum f. kanehirae]|uniref:Putative Ubiquitin and WLM domain-containing protein n=1 Tax=Cinnamomum micranthum f. kanehirae TaxID=337451 RepID=A0A3S3NPA5_9MAGN|nr:putative Ubiquitin and WLM domain-containing protein [Cinnamomum micranthum f. kanehirae]
MAEQQNVLSIVVVWRGKHFNVKMDSNSTIKDFGHTLLTLTNVKPDTMRLLMPRSTNMGSKLLTPFSEEHSSLSLQEAAIVEGKLIRMMGVFDDEIKDMSQNSTKDLRIAGFDEEEKRLKQRLSNKPKASLKLPQGTYVFCDFRTLHIPGIELNPPASEALKRMHMLACDPGIIAVMNKHRWRIGIMTEMAPVGYVGISPKCILGFNKNHGEEISLRLRTDDLKGFRKYESIKKTLLHELAHMVHSEHDANFYALDKQLNQEAASLDWTKSRGHTLSSHRHADFEEIDFDLRTDNSAQKLGGKPLNSSTDASASSVAAAYHRLLNASTNSSSTGAQEQMESIGANGKEAHHESHPDDFETNNGTSGHQNLLEPNPDNSHVKENMLVGTYIEIYSKPSVCSDNRESSEPDPDDCLDDENMFEPDPDDSHCGEAMEFEPNLRHYEKLYRHECCKEPVHADSRLNNVVEPDPDDSQVVETAKDVTHLKLGEYQVLEKSGEKEPDPDDCKENVAILENVKHAKAGPDNSHAENIILVEPCSNACVGDSFATKPDVGVTASMRDKYCMRINEPDPDTAKIDNMMSRADGHNSKVTDSFQMVLASDNEELKRIEDPVAVICTRLHEAIEVLRSEANLVLRTLFKIIKNVIEHPDDMKFRKLRKANPLFQKNIANYRAAMEVLSMVGFCEDVVSDEVGRVETYMVLKRNDPGLLWLAKSSLEMSIG